MPGIRSEGGGSPLVPMAPSHPLSHSLGGAPARGPGGETRPSGPALPAPASALDEVLGQQGARPKRLLPTWCRQMTNLSARFKKISLDFEKCCKRKNQIMAEGGTPLSGVFTVSQRSWLGQKEISGQNRGGCRIKGQNKRERE